ncbi:hypothetical protein F7725_011515 [Dissostichus mawsoni]|uniref:Uncharacterized protein n=1 Tax=Dissostichus mawsoni TaxID=36200 RepID=A0A7J5Z931_DISMA|nr:hypothetical protein F7725_011515 [Dissostichus mawsoni]
MKLKAMGPGAADFQLDMGNANSLHLIQDDYYSHNHADHNGCCPNHGADHHDADHHNLPILSKSLLPSRIPRSEIYGPPLNIFIPSVAIFPARVLSPSPNPDICSTLSIQRVFMGDNDVDMDEEEEEEVVRRKATTGLWWGNVVEKMATVTH